ncbi:hypothetical protein J5751_02315 [bacterium]|nr:hypothetical protein [bacterium]
MESKLESHFFNFGIGFSIHIAATVSLWIDSTAESVLIFFNAEIMASLSLVSNTLQASARYSLLREIASLIKG